ncbi:hypothetical protein HZS_4421 [Henneguya salminicola]|nr:hypothetical protein HZS_4421 [Henneguya salminicola]
MKIKVLSRNPEEYLRETTEDINKIHRNYDNKLHPMHNAREYTRALNAVKLDRMFAKPFISSLSGHKEGVTKIERHPKRISWLASGSMDGEIRVWDLKTSSLISNYQCNNFSVNGLSFSPTGNTLISSTLDCNINIFSITDGWDVKLQFLNTVIAQGTLNSIDYSRNEHVFASGGEIITVWNINKKDPIKTYDLTTENIIFMKFNKIEENIIASLSSDNGFSIYDIRQNVKASKITMNMRGNCLSWHPFEANNIVVGSEDSNCYIFDIRNFKNPTKTYKDHANSVLDVDFSPTGQEFVSASYDKSIRIYPLDSKKSREVYYTKRMQRVFCVSFTADSQYIACGSDEMNIRLWKTNSSKPLGYLRHRQKTAINYNQKLIDKYQFYPEIRKIKNFRHLPRNIFTAVEKKKIENEAFKRKRENARIFSKVDLPSKKTVVDIEK